MTTDTKAAISTAVKPLEVLDILHQLISKITRIRTAEFVATSYHQNGMYWIQSSVLRAPLAVFYGCDCDYSDIAPSGAIGLSMTHSYEAETLMRVIAKVLSVFGPAYFMRSDAGFAVPQYAPLANHATILDLMRAGFLFPHVAIFQKWADFGRTHLAKDPSGRTLNAFLGLPEHLHAAEIRTNADLSAVLPPTSSAFQVELESLYESYRQPSGALQDYSNKTFTGLTV